MITTDANEFIGAHLTREEKEAVRREARDKAQGNMSKWLRLVIREKLRQSGYQIRESSAA